MDDLKARLLGPRADTESGFPEDDVDVPGMGTVRVRGLSRGEQLDAVKQGDIDVEGKLVITRVAGIESRMIAAAMLRPTMTIGEVRQWQRAALAGELERVIAKVQELSGMLEGSAKAAYKSDGDGSDNRVRAISSAETRDDEGAST